MATIATTFPGTRRIFDDTIANHNARLLAEQPAKRRGQLTPELLFVKHFDNSRLIKGPDPRRAREMRIFTAALTLLFSLIMIYGLQHFSAIERSYRVEAEKQLRDQLREENRQLRLSEAQLTQPARIDAMARQYGLTEPRPGQVVHPAALPDPSASVIAQASTPAPVH
jgi:cell division protein FtsL